MSDLVSAIFDSDGNTLFETAKLISISVAPSNTYAQHVLEDGSIMADHKYRNQTRVSMSIMLDPDDYKSVYQDIVNASNNNTKITVQTRVSTYSSMYIEAYPHEESARIYGTVAINISLVEQIFNVSDDSSLTSDDVSSEYDADTTDRGSILASDVSTTVALSDLVGTYQGVV